jgi:uncharacterized membrane protein
MTAIQAPDAPRTDEVVVALFVDQDTAERAIADLRQAGLSEDNIVVAERSDSNPAVVDQTRESPAQGAAQGALSGGIVGGLLGVFGALLLPGVGPAVGGVLGALVAGGVFGAVAGGLIGALVAAGTVTGRVETGDPAGGTLVTVFTDGRAVRAPTILGLLSKKMERRNLPSFNYFGPDRRADGWA